MINAAAERDIKIQITISPSLESCPHNSSLCVMAENDLKKMVKISVAIKPSIVMEQVLVCIFVLQPLKCTVERFVFKEVQIEDTRRFDTYVYMDRSLEVSSLDVKIFVSCINKQSIVRVLERNIRLPLELVFKVTQPQRDAKYKITLTVDEHGQKDFMNLFSESLLIKENNLSTQAVGFRSMYTASVVSVAIAKNSNRYRIQSDQVEALFPFFMHVLEKLQNESKDGENGKERGIKRKPRITPPFVPVEILIGLIEEHYAKREEFNNILVSL